MNLHGVPTRRGGGHNNEVVGCNCRLPGDFSGTALEERERVERYAKLLVVST